MALASFVTPAQLASALGVAAPTGAVLTQWQDALDDASGYLRFIVRQPITSGTATLRLRTDMRGVAEVWLFPATVSAVLDSNGDAVDPTRYDYHEQRIKLPHCVADYDVTVDYGYAETPSEFMRWTKVLAAAQIKAASSGVLNGSPVTSVAVDDAKVTYSDAIQVALPDAVASRLLATYGGSL